MKLVDAIDDAKIIAEYSNMKFKLGAILFDNKNYSFGYNRKFSVSCPKRPNEFSIHAEEMAIIKAHRIKNFDFKNSTLVVVRINKNGEFRNSFPCQNCQKLIEQFNIPNIYYSV